MTNKQARDLMKRGDVMRRLHDTIRADIDRADIICMEQDGVCLDGCAFIQSDARCGLQELKQQMRRHER